MSQYYKYKISDQNSILDFDDLLKTKLSNQDIANVILNKSYDDEEIITRRDTLDRFLDFIYFKVKTGEPHIINLAYPSQRMADKDLENKIIDILNYRLMPDIIIKILRYFTINLKNSQTNLFLAYLIVDAGLIKPIYESFKTFKKDVFLDTVEARCRSVKNLQQHTQRTDPVFSNPLDSACRFKYILEYILLKQNIKNLYSADDLVLWVPSKKVR